MKLKKIIKHIVVPIILVHLAYDLALVTQKLH